LFDLKKETTVVEIANFQFKLADDPVNPNPLLPQYDENDPEWECDSQRQRWPCFGR
jgi:hypothetical protein